MLFKQALAVILADGHLVLSKSMEEDLWEETAVEADQWGQLPDIPVVESEAPTLPATYIVVRNGSRSKLQHAR